MNGMGHGDKNSRTSRRWWKCDLAELNAQFTYSRRNLLEWIFESSSSLAC